MREILFKFVRVKSMDHDILYVLNNDGPGTLCFRLGDLIYLAHPELEDTEIYQVPDEDMYALQSILELARDRDVLFTVSNEQDVKSKLYEIIKTSQDL